MQAMRSAAEIIDHLGGTNEAARFFGVKPPSVTGWVRNGVIPEDRLIRKAAALEKAIPGFTRRDQFPVTYHEIWPELPFDEGEQPCGRPDERMARAEGTDTDKGMH